MENAVYVVHDGRFAVFSISAFVADFARLILHQLSFSRRFFTISTLVT